MFPWLANVAYVFDVVWPRYVDITPYAFALTGAGMTFALFRYRFQAIVPVAWKSVIDSMADCAIVLDSDDHVIALNPAAARLFSAPAGDLISRPLADICGTTESLSPLGGLPAQTEADIRLGATNCRTSTMPTPIRSAPVVAPGWAG